MARISEGYDLPRLTPGEPIGDATVWTAADFAPDRSWMKPLGPAMLAEIDAALRKAMARGIAPKDITPADFPLPATAPRKSVV